MPINYEAAKTLIKGLVQKMKSFRGNWNQNDPTADDYIRNRPFYTEVKESEVYVIPKNSYKFEVGEYAAVYQGNIYQDVIDDKIYTIEIDNNSFELKCKTFDADPVDLKYFGSLSVFVMATNNCDRATASTMVLEQMGIEDTDDNFCIVTTSIPDTNEKICMIGVEDVISETHSVAMYSIEDIEKVHKIDKKYIPKLNYLPTDGSVRLTYDQQWMVGDSIYDYLIDNFAPEYHTHHTSNIYGNPWGVSMGGTGYSSIADTTYTTARYRASSLHSTETNPTTNGTICWTYE